MINNNILSLALLEINNNAKQAKKVANDNFSRAMANKTFCEAYNRARSLQFDLAKLEYEHKDAKQVRQQLNTTYNILSEQLKKLKLSPSDFKPHYVCKICNDSGFVNEEKCHCLKAKEYEIILKQNNLDIKNLHTFKNVNFDVFDSENVNKIKDIYKLAESFVDTQNAKKTNFIMFGNTGVGKTYLCECMLNKAITSNTYAFLTTAFNLSEVLIKYHVADIESKTEILEPYLTCDLLIIDDLGSEKILNNISREYLYIILSERTNNNLKTVVSTNLSPEAIMDVYDERIFSRIVNKRDNVLVNFDGIDLRLKK